MNIKQNTQTRRQFLKRSGVAMVFVPSALIASRQAFAQDEMVDPTSAIATGFGYVEQSETEGKNCSNCGLYVNGDEVAGNCPLFQGVKVGAEAWCTAWAPKA